MLIAKQIHAQQLALATGLSKQQVNSWMRNHKRKSPGEIKSQCPKYLPSTVDHLMKWYNDHESHPYTTKEDKQELALATGLSKRQVKTWMSQRRWKIRNASGKVTSCPRHPPSAVDHLKRWYSDHEANPHPTKEENQELALATGLSKKQVS